MATIKATAQHQRVHQDLTALLKKHENLTALEMLAVASQFVGQLLALQDQRLMSGEEYINVITRNIEIGNAGAIETFMGEVKGHG